MKKLLLSIVMLSVSGIIYAGTPAQKLLARLTKIQKKGIMFGHQDAPMYGTTWKWDEGRGDVLEVCGDYPAVMGFDLGKIELGSDKNLDGVPFSRMRKEIAAQHARGGIVTLSWHPWNPVTGNNAWDPEGSAVTAVLPGGDKQQKMEGWIDTVIDFIGSLKTEKGKAIPVIFRPWHEMTGGWFWWGSNSCTPEEYKQLYRMTVDRFRRAGLTNVVWSYSPGADAKETAERFLTYYPGDEYVDMIGTDAYQFSTTQDFISLVQNEMKIMSGIARKHGKLFALTEAGYRNTPQSDWFTQGLLPSISDSGASYVLLWRNAWDNPEENFGPAPDKNTSDDFRKFYADKQTLFLKDIKKIK